MVVIWVDFANKIIKHGSVTAEASRSSLDYVKRGNPKTILSFNESNAGSIGNKVQCTVLLCTAG